jgi:anti-anti-sigma factor
MSTDWSENIVIAELGDEPALSDELAAVIDRLIATPNPKVPHVVLNFGSVTYVNSSNLAQLLRLRKRLLEAGRQIKLCSVSDEVWSVMMVTGLDKVFRFAPDPMTALAGLQLEDSDQGKKK